MNSRIRLVSYTLAGRVAASAVGAVTVQANQKLFECFILSLRLAFLWEKLSVVDTLSSKLFLKILWQRDPGRFLHNS